MPGLGRVSFPYKVTQKIIRSDQNSTHDNHIKMEGVVFHYLIIVDYLILRNLLDSRDSNCAYMKVQICGVNQQYSILRNKI